MIRWQRGNWKAEKRRKLICRARLDGNYEDRSTRRRGTEIRIKGKGGGRSEGRGKEREKGWMASIDYEARRTSLMADGDIYRVNGRRASIPT